MEFNNLVLIGWVAAAASIGSFVAQAIKIVRERNAQGISVATYAMTLVTFALWTAYGIIKSDPALLAANAICFALSGFILFMIILPASKRNRIAAKIEAAIGEEMSSR